MVTARPRQTLRLVARLLGWLQTAWSICGIVLVLLLVLNALASWGRSRSGFDTLRGDDEFKSAAAKYGFDDLPVFAQFAAEFDDSMRLNDAGRAAFRVRWEPFSYWRSAPFQGKFHTVTPDGLRGTWRASDPTADRTTRDTQLPPAEPLSAEPPPTPAPPPAAARRKRVFLFGGSTMWGQGARDEHTIASELAKQLAAEGVVADVFNCGQLGYVSTQELIMLERELQRGNVPDLVVFYDGVNDVGAATQRAIAGQSVHEAHRVDEFNIVYNTTLRRSAWGLVRGTPLFKTVRDLRGADKQQIAAHWQDKSFSEVALGVLTVYNGNLRIVTSLGREFGFGVLFCWQPTVFQKERCSALETQIRDDHQTTGDFYRLVYNGVTSIRQQRPPQYAALASSPDFYDLSGAFNQPDWGERHVFWDFCHLTEAGNAQIARQMLPLVRERLARQPQSPPQSQP